MKRDNNIFDSSAKKGQNGSAVTGLVVVLFVLFVLGYLACVYSAAACRWHEMPGYGHSLHWSLQDHWPVSVVVKCPNKFGTAQVVKLVSISDTPGQPDANLVSLPVFQADLRRTWHRVEYPVAPLEQHKADIRLADNSITASEALLLINRVKVIGDHEISHTPNISSWGGAVIFRSDLIGETGISIFVNLQWRGLNRVQPFIKTNPRTNREARLFQGLLKGVLHYAELTVINNSNGSTYGYRSQGEDDEPFVVKRNIRPFFFWVGIVVEFALYCYIAWLGLCRMLLRNDWWGLMSGVLLLVLAVFFLAHALITLGELAGNFSKEKGRLRMKTESPNAGTLPKTGENSAGWYFQRSLLMRFERRSFGVEIMFPANTGFAEVEPIPFFHSKHPACDRMVNLRLQLADKAVKRPHLENGHEAQILQHPALPGNDVESVIEGVKTSVRPGLPFKMVYSQFAPPSAGWSGMRQC